MNEYKSTARLKSIAAERSLGRYGTLIGANIIIYAIQVIVSAITTVSTGGSLFFIITNNIITLIVNILLGLLVSGKAYLYMNLLYSQPVAASDIFFGLKQQPQKAVAIQAHFVIVDFLISIPGQLLMIQYQKAPDANSVLAAVLALSVGLCINIIFSLVYSQSFFILHDFPDRTAVKILASSRHLMKGNIFRLFYLHVSFIPLYILGCLTLFVPILWINVYHYAATCAFYQDLIESTVSTGK